MFWSIFVYFCVRYNTSVITVRDGAEDNDETKRGVNSENTL